MPVFSLLTWLRRGIIVWSLFAAGIFLGACSEEVWESDFLDGTLFFPVEKGRVWIYASDSIVYANDGSVRDTFKGWVREEVGEEFIGDDGSMWTEWLRFFSRDSTIWTPVRTWRVMAGDGQVIRVEENLPFIKMVYPFREGTRWEGNVLFDEDRYIQLGGERIQPYQGWRYRISLTEEGLVCPTGICRVVRVDQIDEASILDRRKSVEYYAEGIGLFRKEMVILDGDGSRPNDPWDKKAKKGFIHNLRLVYWK